MQLCEVHPARNHSLQNREVFDRVYCLEVITFMSMLVMDEWMDGCTKGVQVCHLSSYMLHV